MHGFLGGTRVHVLQAVRQRIHLLDRHKVGFADKNLIGKPHLAACFLAVIELGHGVLGIHQGQNRVQQVAFSNFIVHEEGLRYRAGVGQAGGFDHHAVKIELTLALFLGQIAQGVAQVLADSATNAAIAHLDDLLLGLGNQDVAVNIFLTKLVFDHGDFLAVRLCQHAFEEGGFARAEKARQDCCRDKTHRAVGWVDFKRGGV